MSRVDPTGVSRILTYIKTWITGLLSNKSDTTHTHSDYVPKSGGEVLEGQDYKRTVDNSTLNIYGGQGYGHGAFLQLTGTGDLGAGEFNIQAHNGVSNVVLKGKHDGTLTWGSKNLAMQEDTIPRSGGATITGQRFSRTVDNSELVFSGGTDWESSATLALHSKGWHHGPGSIWMQPRDDIISTVMSLYPNGTWTWTGTAIQYVSDQRLKQQISNIDDKLLDAWEGVLPCQFKYNEAVEQKGDTARLHTGYVVQQIDEACKSHNLDISAYGLYCHEEYPERTEEVEVKQDDGSVIKETKVIEPAREHYSLRYTEALIVECAFLRREVKRLSERLEKLEK